MDPIETVQTIVMLLVWTVFIDLNICNSLEKEKQIRHNYDFADPPVAPLGLELVGIQFSIHIPPLWGYEV